MAHKRKTAPWSKEQTQKKKSEYYIKLDKYMKELFSERTKENALHQQIRELEVKRLSCDETKQFAKKYNVVPIRTQIVGWQLPYPNMEEAFKILAQDRSNIERDINILKTQKKIAIERQTELHNILKNHFTDGWYEEFEKT